MGLESKEDDISIIKTIEKMRIKEKKDKEKTLLLMSNADYIHWIDKYIKLGDCFSDDDYDYFSAIISDEDKDQIELLPLFYRGINNYAGSHYIYATFFKSGEYYKVKYDNIELEIGTTNGQKSTYFCNKVVFDEGEDFIDFKDIILENKQERADQITESLNNIVDSIISAYENGVPLKSIESTLVSSIKNVKTKHKENRGRQKTYK